MDQSNRFQSEEKESADMPRGIHERLMIATILVSILVLLTPIAAKALNVGDKAPDFLAFSTVGESVRLSDYQGKKNVLIFFFVRAFGGV
jgi:AhpC/TSA family